MAQEPARRRRRRADHERRRRRPQPQLRRRTGTTTTRARRRIRRARPTAAPARRPSPRRGRWTACCGASASPSRSTTTRPPSCCSTRSASRSRPTRPTTRSIEALSGTDDKPAIAGNAPGAPHPYDPDVSAELYTTNGETTDHAHAKYDTLAWTPEMDVADPARGGGQSVFEFQDSEADLQAAFEKNIPFALDVAESAKDPANPVSHLGNEVPDFEIKPFKVSYGDPQPVEADVKRSLGAVRVHWSVNGGEARSAPAGEYRGGERYGGAGDVYFHRVRGNVRGTKPGDRVRVWFQAGRRGTRSSSFTYTARSESRAPVLVLSAEDYSGLQPNTAPGTGPNYLRSYEDALRAAGHPLRRLRRRRRGAHGSGPARRARPLRGGALVHGRRPVRPRAGDGRRDRHLEAGRRRDHRRARLPQRRRQAALHRPERGVRAAVGLRLQPCRSAAVLRAGRRGAATASRSPTTSSSTTWGPTCTSMRRPPRRRRRRCRSGPPAARSGPPRSRSTAPTARTTRPTSTRW